MVLGIVTLGSLNLLETDASCRAGSKWYGRPYVRGNYHHRRCVANNCANEIGFQHKLVVICVNIGNFE